jgi:ketosteroid isomerase-like protein
MQSSPELAIRLRRGLFNRALAACDLGPIAGFLAPDAVLVTGTDSAVLAGRKAQVQAWKREFAASPPTVYTRTPDTITLSPVEPIAFEHGHWQGATAGTVQASGAYTAKWRETAGIWMIEAELYLTLA